MRFVVAALLICGCTKGPRESLQPTAAVAVNAARHVAITIDDLGNARNSQASAEPALSSQILRQLQRAAAPVAVFVNCVALRDETLALWQAAGATIGNHTETHLSLDAAPAGPGEWVNEHWWNDVLRCHERLTRVLGGPVEYFRFPYLRYGASATRKRQAALRLASLHYRIAHVTAATSEWLLAQYYDVAREQSDTALAAAIASRYVAHMVDSLAAAEHMGRTKLGVGGQGIPQITLLHVNRLAAEHLGDVLAALAARGWKFVTLSEALQHPVYAREDAYVGPCGCSWFARVAPAHKPGDDYIFEDYEAELQAEFEARVAALRRR